MNLVDFRKSPEEANCYGKIIGSSRKMKDVYKMIADFSQYGYPVLIWGETGTGKELVTEEIYNTSREAGKDMKCLVKLNCAAIPENLIESELFGYKKGSFTGAAKDKKGKFQIADEGILFLDEIGDTPLYTQAKILQVVERGEFQPLGYEKAEPIKVKVRIITATNKILKREITAGKFRKDLFYRLNVCGLHIPSLKERNSDIILLSRYFLEKHNKEYGEKRSLDNDTFEPITNYDWPGNVRQLENFIKKAATRSRENTIKENHIRMLLNEESDLETRPEESGPKLILEAGCRLRYYEKEIVNRTLEETGNNISRAAKILGVSRKTIRSISEGEI